MNLLKWFKKEPKPELHQTQEERDKIMADQRKYSEMYSNQAAIAKAAWESENDRLKKLDACNLGMTHLAFNGTYEEFDLKQKQADLARMQAYAVNSYAQMQAMQNCAGHQGWGNYGNYGNNPLTRIFG